MAQQPDALYNLLPATYRERDAAEGFPLRALIRLIAAQADLVDGDIQGLYDNLFIETCDTWVIPYIGDLVSNNTLYDSTRLSPPDTAKTLFPDLAGRNLRPPVAIRIRADVAKTIFYRRRKGTLPMLEELARDVTGWPAHAVEFFELLGWTQFREHLRFQSCWANLRSIDTADRINGAFDEVSHSVDVRKISQHQGWYNIPNIGFFLWRLNAYPLQNVPARVASLPWRFHFSPIGNPAPLFSRWRPKGDDSGLATELHVSGPIRPTFFFNDLEKYRNTPPPRPDFTDLYGLFETIPGDPTEANGEASLFIRLNGVSMTPAIDPTAPVELFSPRIVCRKLDPWPAVRPSGPIIEVDVSRGRFAIGDGLDITTGPDVWLHYGFAADMGGGPYERTRWLVSPDAVPLQFRVKADNVVPPGTPPPTHNSVTAAIADWITGNRPDTVIRILDSRNYALPESIELANERVLVIEAANGERPLLQTEATGLRIEVAPPAIVGSTDRDSALTLSGVVVEGFVRVNGDLGRLRLPHSTLIPGRGLTEDGDPITTEPSILIAPTDASGVNINQRLELMLAFSITGPLIVPEHATRIFILDSIVDGLGGSAINGAPGSAPVTSAPLTVERSTFLGAVDIRELEASESIFTAHVETERTQEGCVRFCYVPPGSRTPRLYRCQPDLAIESALADALKNNPFLTAAERDAIRKFIGAALVPAFTTRRYGLPAYGQLHLNCPVEIRTGAEDGSEMGAFCALKQPQRESNLRIRLDEYLPFGLDAGIVFVT